MDGGVFIFKNRVFTFLLLSQLLHLAGCQLGKIQIDYVFPDGFRGAAVIREDRGAVTEFCRLKFCCLN